MNQNILTRKAAAKVNLFLHITGKRPDSYHLLQSVMVFVDVGDEMSFAPYQGFFIDVEGPFAEQLGPLHENMVYKAAKMLADEYKKPLQAKIVLKKNLPIASGIAGGSSNAAMTLRGLAQLWRLPEETGRLQKMAEALGADVPACMYARPVWTEGIGEKMTYLQGMPDFYFVLANPMLLSPTPEVFRRFKGRFSPALAFSGRRKSMQEWIADLKLYRNDLTEAAQEVCPPIRDVLRALENTPNCRFARLSGSGATCFGVYDNPSAAQAAVNKIRQEYPRWWVVATSTLKQ